MRFLNSLRVKLLVNMKYINYFLIFCFFCACSCSKKKEVDLSQMYPPYRLIHLFSQKIKQDSGLILRSYGINNFLPENYEYINGIRDFSISYSLGKTKNDEISLDHARNLVVYLVENLLEEINSNNEVTPDLDVYPFISDLLTLSIYFEDESRIHLGQGVAMAHLYHGKIKYKGYYILKYRDRYPAEGRHYLIHEESYAEALEKVKKQGNLKMLSS